MLGDPVSHSLSPLMQNAAFAARGLDWAYVPLAVTAEQLADAVRGLVALGFAGANVTTPHKLAVAKLVARPRRIGEHARDSSWTRARVFDRRRNPRRPRVREGRDHRRRRRRTGVRDRAPRGEPLLPPWRVAAGRCKRRPRRERDVGAREIVVRLRPDQTLVDLPYPRTATAETAEAEGASVIDGLEVLVAQGAASFEAWTGIRHHVRSCSPPCAPDLRSSRPLRLPM